jgi:hypothetical protein
MARRQRRSPEETVRAGDGVDHSRGHLRNQYDRLVWNGISFRVEDDSLDGTPGRSSSSRPTLPGRKVFSDRCQGAYRVMVLNSDFTLLGLRCSRCDRSRPEASLRPAAPTINPHEKCLTGLYRVWGRCPAVRRRGNETAVPSRRKSLRDSLSRAHLGGPVLTGGSAAYGHAHTRR